MEEEYGNETSQRLKVGALGDNLEHALMELADRLEGLYTMKTLTLLHSVVLPESFSTLTYVVDQYAEFKTTRY